MTNQAQDNAVAQAAAKEAEQAQAQPKTVDTSKAEAKTTKAKKVAEEKPVIVKDTKNGVTRPGKDTDTGRVWAICDTLNASATDEDPISRAKVIKHAEAKGLNPSTAATQYGRWRTYNGLARETSKAVKPAAAEAAVEQAQPKGEAKAPVEQAAEGAGFSLDPK